MAPTSARRAGAAAIAGVRRRLGREGPLLDRIKLLFLNVLVAVLTPLDLTNPGAPTWPRSGVMLAAFMGLGVWAVVYLRANRPSLLLDLVPLPCCSPAERRLASASGSSPACTSPSSSRRCTGPAGAVCGFWPRATS